MATSLARQLSVIKTKSLAVSTLDRKKRQKAHSVSLLFSPADASKQDLDSVFVIAYSGFQELVSLDSRFRVFERSLFAESSITIDRHVQTEDQNANLDKAIEHFLSLIASRILLQPSLKALEWLIRRFHINEMNRELLLLTFLPYYSHSIFSRILDVISTPLPPLFNFLSNAKVTTTVVPKNLLIRALTRDAQLFNLVSDFIVSQVSHHFEYHTLLSFWTSSTIAVILNLKSSNTSEEVISERVIPHLSEVLTAHKSPEAQTAAYMIVIILVAQCSLSAEVLNALSLTIALNWTKKSSTAGLAALTQCFQFVDIFDNQYQPLDDRIFKSVSRIEDLSSDLRKLSQKIKVNKFLVSFSLSILQNRPEESSKIIDVLRMFPLSDSQAQFIIERMFQLSALVDSVSELKSVLSQLISDSESDLKLQKMVFTSVKALDMNLDDVELKLNAKFPVEVNIEPKDINFDRDLKPDQAVFTERIRTACKVHSVSYLGPNTSAEFQEIADIFVQGVYEHQPLSSMLIKNVVLFPPESDLALTFLMRFWVGVYPTLARLEALVMFEKFIESVPVDLDLQATIPYLLIALDDSSEAIREISCRILRYLHTRYNQISKCSGIWGLDTLYGSGSETKELKWLGLKEVRVMLANYIDPRLEECLLDRHYARTVISQLIDTRVKLGAEKTRKESSLKQIVLTSFASHITSCPVFKVKYVLLSYIITSKTSVSLSSLCAPLLSSWIESRSHKIESLIAERLSVTNFEALLSNIVCGGDIPEGKQFISNCIKADISGLSDVAGTRLVDTWNEWDFDSQIDFLEILITIALDENAAYGAIDCLTKLNISTQNFSRLLSSCILTVDSSDLQEQQQSKRRRRQSNTARSADDRLALLQASLRKVTLILDLLEDSKPETHSKLLKQLFSILGELFVLKTDSSLPVQYTQQVLVDCILPIIKTLSPAQLNPSIVRMDIIVSCIRTTTAPQVQNKFLLLVASLASVSPELVLHSVMPIFTFMGANTIRQDDEFSAHVIQQTISKVVPALAVSTSSGADSGSGFGIAELLQSFVSAFPHIPYHRRIQLFITLARTLGPNDSLALTLRLLAKQHWDSVLAGETEVASELSEFVEIFLRGFTISERIYAVSRYFDFVKATPANLDDEDKREVYVEDLVGLGKDKILLFKIDMLVFIRGTLNESVRLQLVEAFSPASGTWSNTDVLSLQSSFASAIDILTAIVDSSAGDKRLKKYQDEAYETLESVLNVLPIQDFVLVIEELISRSGDPATVRRGLVIIRSKFEHNVKANDVLGRNSALKILPSICAAISDCASDDFELCKLGFQVLESLSSLFGSIEPDAFEGEVLELTLSMHGVRNPGEGAAVSALVCLSSLVTALGARILSKLPEIIQISLTILERAINEGKTLVVIAVFMLIDSLVKRIPMFMASYLNKILGLVFISASDEASVRLEDSESARNVLLENVISKVPTKQLIGALLASASEVLASWDISITKLYLSLMTQVVERGARKSVMSEASNLFSFLIAGFNSRNDAENDPEKLKIVGVIEQDSIDLAMQIVLKMNDKTFRPLFVRVTRWAMEDPVESDLARKNRLLVTFKLCEKLFGSLKSIVTNYYGYIIDNTTDLLISFVSNPTVDFDRQLWDAIVGTLYAAFSNDQEEFWQAPVRFDKICGPLIAQLALGLHDSEILSQAILAFAVSCSSEEHYKTINNCVLGYMKDLSDSNEDMSDDESASEDAQDSEDENDYAVKLLPSKISRIARSNTGSSASDVKIAAIKTLKAIYERLGEEWLGMLPQLVPVVAELLEDQDETVETEVQRDLVPVIEGVLGESLDRYLN
ncbi:uncharacterized protein V1516DRAFT_712548 [Lipomyces oligophaga]|uniref:uncharacterized protein n=1 Tax=Lipomyces oligophaga TaxID=45792 RepID=UPI0034CD67DB